MADLDELAVGEDVDVQEAADTAEAVDACGGSI